ncbi:MAG: hypothetical protein PHX20_05425 [Candidatus Omnitrophica bacterium]|nr:hypothetical protein [Candidatus Omnitrophota bacterium]MDD5436966.1 hypothetical protein [Candidatus Omnitrophota bacterium]
MRPGKILSILFVILIAAIAIVFFNSGRIAVYLIEKRCDLGKFQKAYDITINYKKCSIDLPGVLVFKDLSVISRKNGFGFICKRADIRPSYDSKKFALSFDLQDVNFARESKEREGGYDTIIALVATPFDERWKYSHIRGRIEPDAQLVGIKNFELLSDDIRLVLNGNLFYTGTIESDIVIYFSSALAAKVPPELADTLFAGEKDGWRSLSVRIAGDPNKPSIQVSSKLFRLSIKSVSGT